MLRSGGEDAEVTCSIVYAHLVGSLIILVKPSRETVSIQRTGGKSKRMAYSAG